MSRYKNRSSLGFNDLLLNLVIGITALFILSFILINPVAKKAVIEPKTEFIITVDWNDQSEVDLDIWIKDNYGNIVNFVRKENALVFLDRDDLGLTNDTMVNPETGQVTTVKINREVISIKTREPKEYTVSLHWYGKNSQEPVTATIELISVNPYSIISQRTAILTEKGQEVKIFKFTVNEDGKVHKVEDATEAIVFFRDRVMGIHAPGGP